MFLFLLILGCRKDQEIFPKQEKPLPSYIKNLLQPDNERPYTGLYYIEARFINNETLASDTLHFNAYNASMAFRYDSPDKRSGISEHTVMFVGSAGEHLEISFYYDPGTDTTFYVCCADYFYADAWRNLPGANVQYSKPSNDGNGSRVYAYQGFNSDDSCFKIMNVEMGHVNGVFHTTWKECCGEPTTYDVTGSFSIPTFDTHR